MPNRIILATERRRRVVTLVSTLLVAQAYFYEYPLYVLLKVYSQYQGWGGLNPVPGLTNLDYVFIFICVSVIAFVYLRPRSYLRSDGGGQTFTLYRKGASVDTISKSNLSTLVVKTVYKRRSPSRDSSFTGSTKIYSSKNPEIIFYDAVPTRLWWYEKRLARRIERQLGGGVTWVDEDGILSGVANPEREARVKRREEQMKGIAEKSRRTPPKIVKAYGFRLFLLLVFATVLAPSSGMRTTRSQPMYLAG